MDSKNWEPSEAIQDFLVMGEYGDVNPSITDSSTFTFSSPEKMQELFNHEIEGCFLYSRHWNPTNKCLSQILARMESAEAAQVTSSGMAAISTTILQLCNSGDEVISSRTVYGGTYALFKNFLPKFGIKVHFVDMNDLSKLESCVNEKTKVVYSESMSNPLLHIADIPNLSKFCKQHNLTLVIDNTFTPLILSPIRLGADVVIYSLTKFVNGTSDCVAGAVCSSNDFIKQLTGINDGASMLLGTVLDSNRAASILKNIHSLHLRMRQHSHNAQFIANQWKAMGLNVFYPGLEDHPQHHLLKSIMNEGYGFGGMVALDVGSFEVANQLMSKLQENKVGYLAVSLGYFKTLFSSPGHSTSSEIPKDEQDRIGLTEGLIRFSIGLDNDIRSTFVRIKKAMSDLKIVENQ